METEKPIEEITGESRHERTAREIAELLQELRVVLPGVQVLFAFLLTVPFSARFGEVSTLEQTFFFGRSCVPASLRYCFSRLGSPQASVAQAGKGASPSGGEQARHRGHNILVLAMVGAMFLISDFLYGSALAAVATASLTIFFVYVWFVMPLRYRLNGE
jgi:hypothetical protein